MTLLERRNWNVSTGVRHDLQGHHIVLTEIAKDFVSVNERRHFLATFSNCNVKLKVFSFYCNNCLIIVIVVDQLNLYVRPWLVRPPHLPPPMLYM